MEWYEDNYFSNYNNKMLPFIEITEKGNFFEMQTYIKIIFKKYLTLSNFIFISPI